MKFNKKKWEWFEQHGNDLHKKFNSLHEELEHLRRTCALLEGDFAKSWDYQYIATDVIRKDKKLSSSAIEKRIEALKNNWPTESLTYKLDKQPECLPQLLRLYKKILELRKLTEHHDEGRDEWSKFNACKHVLTEFASDHVKISQPTYDAV